jgi:hypothetical protein
MRVGGLWLMLVVQKVLFEGRKGGRRSGYQGKIAALEHKGRVIRHNIVSLDMEIREHGIGLPAANQADTIVINILIKESHGAGRAERFCVDVCRQDSGWGGRVGDGGS